MSEAASTSASRAASIFSRSAAGFALLLPSCARRVAARRKVVLALECELGEPQPVHLLRCLHQTLQILEEPHVLIHAEEDVSLARYLPVERAAPETHDVFVRVERPRLADVVLLTRCEHERVLGHLLQRAIADAHNVRRTGADHERAIDVEQRLQAARASEVRTGGEPGEVDASLRDRVASPHVLHHRLQVGSIVLCTLDAVPAAGAPVGCGHDAGHALDELGPQGTARVRAATLRGLDGAVQVEDQRQRLATVPRGRRADHVGRRDGPMVELREGDLLQLAVGVGHARTQEHKTEKQQQVSHVRTVRARSRRWLEQAARVVAIRVRYPDADALHLG